MGIESLGLDLQAFANGLPGGFFVYEAHGHERILFANDQMAPIFGCATVEEFLELVGGTFPGLVYDEDLTRVQNEVWLQTHRDPQPEVSRRDHVTYRIVTKSGNINYIEEYGRLVKDTAAGDLFFVFVSKIVAEPIGRARMSHPMSHPHVNPDVDPLTGLCSMPYYHQHCSLVLAQAAVEHTPMVDVFFDVDHFRAINFRLGYDAGDELLQRIANILRKTFPNDLLARFSDDHFVLVSKRQGLEERLEEAHARVADLVHGMHIELKAGIFELDENDVTIPFAHDRAKVACSSVKGRYDTFYRFYDKTLAVSEELRDYIVNHIEQAVEQGWIQNRYQSVLHVDGTTMHSMEALSRWVDPNVGMILPSQYVYVLEESRLIHLLDAAVVENACADLRRDMDRGDTVVPVSLNFSPTALSLIDVPSLVERTARKYGIPSHLIHVEITESSLTDDPELLRTVIARLHNLGIEVWMDDFGSGYSSLNLLKDYDFDVLKVDMEFLRGMEKNDRSRTIVRSITDLAHNLGMATLVEGVETTEQLEFLRDVGADLAQGYLFSKPTTHDEILASVSAEANKG